MERLHSKIKTLPGVILERIKKRKRINRKLVQQLNEKDSFIQKLRSDLKSLSDDNEKLSRNSKLMEIKLEKQEQACSECEAAKLLSEAKVCQFEKRLAEFDRNRNDLERYKKENELLTVRVSKLDCQKQMLFERAEIQAPIQEYFENGSELPNHVQQALKNFNYNSLKINSPEKMHPSKSANKFKNPFKIFRPNPPKHANSSSVKISDGRNLSPHCIHPNNK